MGRVLVRTLLQRVAVVVILSFGPGTLQEGFIRYGMWGASTLGGSSVSMFSSTSSSTTTSESPC